MGNRKVTNTFGKDTHDGILWTDRPAGRIIGTVELVAEESRAEARREMTSKQKQIERMVQSLWISRSQKRDQIDGALVASPRRAKRRH
jgi:hypothetical protein